jgi:hypothetical protein
MRTIFGIIAMVLLAAYFSSQPAVAGEKEACSQRCEVLHNAPGTGLKPPVPKQVCFRFIQPSADFVVFTLYDQFTDLRHNHILRQIKHWKKDDVRGQFCIGSQWVRQAVWVDICNHINHSDRGIPSLKKGLESGMVDMCLNGETCPRFVPNE